MQIRSKEASQENQVGNWVEYNFVYEDEGGNGEYTKDNNDDALEDSTTDNNSRE